MAKKKLSFSEISDATLIEGFEKLIKLADELEGRLKSLVKAGAAVSKEKPLDSYKNIKEVEKGIEDTGDALKELEKIESDRLKLVAKQKELTNERTKANFKLREEIKLQSKELRDAAKTLTNYQKLLKSTNEAQLAFKEAAADFGVDSAEAQKALEVFEKLDAELRQINTAAKDGRRDVGRYELAFKDLSEQIELSDKKIKDLSVEFGKNSKEVKAARKDLKKLNEQMEDLEDSTKEAKKGTESLSKGLKALAAATVILKILDVTLGALTDAFSANDEGASSAAKAIGRFTISVQVFVNRLIKFGPQILDFFTSLGSRIEAFFLRMELNILESIQSMIKGISEFEVFGQKLGIQFDSLNSKIEETRKELEETNRAIPSIINSFEGMSAEIADLIAKNDKLIDITLKYRKEIVAQQKELAVLIPIQRELEAIAGDATVSIQAQIAANQALLAVTETVNAREIQIANRRFELALQNSKVNKFNVESQEELAQATLELAEAEAEQLAARRDITKEINQLRNDQIEQNLDFFIDDFDNLKTINERIIADETQTFELRRKLAQQNLELASKSFQLQEDEINESLTRQGKAILDFDELRKSTSAENNARIVEESGLSEQLGIRALEIIRERRTVLQDLADTEKELSEIEKESKEVQEDLILTNAALLQLEKEGVDVAIVLDKLSEDRLQNEIDNLRFRLNLAEEGTESALNINQELNDKLLQQNQERIEKEEEQEKASLEKKKEIAEAVFNAISELVGERFDKRISEIDAEISAEEKRADQLRELAAQGNEDALNNLAVTQERQARLELEREKQIKRQQQSELILAGLEAYSSKVASGDKNALASTFTDVAILKAGLSALSGFIGGTEDTGTDGIYLDNTGEKVTGYTHENEKVLNKYDSSLIPKGMSNLEVAMHAANAGGSIMSRGDDYQNRMIAGKLDEVRDAVMNKPAYMGRDYNATERAIVETVERKGRRERKHIKTGGIYGN